MVAAVKNLANLVLDPAIKAKVEKELIPLLPRIRNDRWRFDERNQRFYRLWNCELDKNSYMGRSKIFLPAARATIETFTNSIGRDFFPASDAWYDVTAIEDISEEARADALKAAFDYFFTRKQKLKSDAMPGIRQLVLYGTSPFKVSFLDKDIEMQTLERGNLKKITKKVKLEYGPRIQPRDLFNFFVWPTTADSVQDASITIEDIEVTLDHLVQYAKKPLKKNAPEQGYVYEIPEEVFQQKDQQPKEWFRHRRERLQRMGLSSDPSDRWSELSWDRRNLSEIYWRTDLDGTGYNLWLVTVVNDFYPIRIQKNPYWHQQRPYLVPRLMRCVGEFYGRGIMEVIDRINYMMNDVVNQTMDSVQYEINPITLIDPSGVAFPNSVRLHPGAKWLINDPTKNVVFSKPASVAAVGFTTLSLLQGYIHDFSGANAAMQGQPAVRGRGRYQNTASGMQTLLSQGSSTVVTMVEDLEQEFGEPALYQSYSLMEQFYNEKLMLRILGRKGAPIVQKRVELADIVGNYEFKWLGATSTRNRQIVGQQMINFLNIARGFPPQILQSLNWEWLIKKIWSEAFGMKGQEELFSPQGSMTTVDPTLEFKLMLENRPIKVSPGDDDQIHLKQHYIDREKVSDPDILVEWDMHIKEHVNKLSQMVQQQKQMQMMQALAQAQQGGEGGGSESGGARPQNMPSGLNENPLQAMMAQTQQ